MKLASRLEGAKPSPTLAITARAKELQAKGLDVVALGAGEPDFDTPQRIKDAAAKALAEGFTKYTATPGIPALREAIAARTTRDTGVKYAASETIACVGAKHVLYNAFQALLDPGDEVVIFAPYWASYADIVRLALGTPVVVETREENGFEPAPDAVRRAITPKTRAVVVCSPSNPTGAVFSRASLQAVVDAVKGTDILVVTDDIYDRLTYRGKFENVLTVDPTLKGQTLVVNGVSKTYAMTGWRLGWGVGPAELIAAMQKLQDNSTSNPTSIAQKAALAALTLPGLDEEVEAMRKVFDQRRRHVVDRLNAIPGIRCFDPGGAFYAFPNVSKLLALKAPGQKEALSTDERLVAHLLDAHQTAVVPGAPFHAPGYIRLSFATSLEQLDKGLDRIEACARSLS